MKRLATAATDGNGVNDVAAEGDGKGDDPSERCANGEGAVETAGDAAVLAVAELTDGTALECARGAADSDGDAEGAAPSVAAHATSAKMYESFGT